MHYDPIGLRPATEDTDDQPAVQQRQPGARHRRAEVRVARRPALVFIATAGLLVGGAGAFALARPDEAPELVQPYGPDAPFGVGYVDGFGEHSPQPSSSPSASRKPKPPQSTAKAAATGGGQQPSPVDTRSALSTQVTGVYWSKVFNGKFETYVWVHNGGRTAAAWEVRIKLPQSANVTGSSASHRTFVDGAWVFTSTRGNLGANLVYLFSFSGTTGSSKFSLGSCTVNGSSCKPFG